MSANASAPRPQKLEDQIRQACRVRHYSLATERIYVRWYKDFVRWAGLKHPATLGGDRVEAWLSYLATGRDVAASTQRQALAAILFLYRQVLGLRLPWLDNVTRAKQPQHLPRVLSQQEVRAIVEHLPRTSAGLAVALTYATGMRQGDVLRLRVQDLDFERRVITTGCRAVCALRVIGARLALNPLNPRRRRLLGQNVPHRLARPYSSGIGAESAHRASTLIDS